MRGAPIPACVTATNTPAAFSMPPRGVESASLSSAKLTLSSGIRTLNLEDANSRWARATVEGNNGEGRAGWIGRDRGGLAERARPAARRALESAVLRRSRHAHRQRRHVVLPEAADRPLAAGQAVRLRAQEGGGQLFPRYAGREGRTDGGRCTLSGGRNVGRQGRSGPPDAQLPHQC